MVGRRVPGVGGVQRGRLQDRGRRRGGLQDWRRQGREGAGQEEAAEAEMRG
jgi:hypothetical protein